ncbi:MAG: hypothetical protein ABI591_11495 [Kofleriaceae bacterium]
MTPPPAVVTAAWDEVIAHWDEPARHDTLLGLVVANNCFAWAAGRYKAKAGDPIADKNLERLRKAATVTMMATAAPRPDESKVPYRNAMLVLIVLAILMGVGVIYAKFRDKTAVTQTAP